MLKTFDRTLWVEDPLQEKAREHINGYTSETTLRELYPFSCVITKDVRSYNLKAGQVLQYARTLYEPNMYPVECVIGVVGEPHPTDKPKRLRLHSTEVLVCEV